MTTSTLCNLCIALHVSADYLLFGKTQEETIALPIIEMIKNLSPEEQVIAEDMLKVLIRRFSIKESK